MIKVKTIKKGNVGWGNYQILKVEIEGKQCEISLSSNGIGVMPEQKDIKVWTTSRAISFC